MRNVTSPRRVKTVVSKQIRNEERPTRGTGLTFHRQSVRLLLGGRGSAAGRGRSATADGASSQSNSQSENSDLLHGYLRSQLVSVCSECPSEPSARSEQPLLPRSQWKLSLVNRQMRGGGVYSRIIPPYERIFQSVIVGAAKCTAGE